MKTAAESSDEKAFVGKAVEASIRIAVIGALVVMCYKIVLPFILPIVWGMIIAVAAYPMYNSVVRLLKGRKGLAATAVTLMLLLVLLVPALLLTGTLISGFESLADKLNEGTLRIPPPPTGVETWPIIGQKLAGVWGAAAANFENTLLQFAPEIKMVGVWLLSAAGQVGFAVLIFFASVIIAGVILAHSEQGAAFAHRFAHRLSGDRGDDLVRVAESAVRSVASGVLGVAFIQSALAGLGLLVAGIPGAGFWAFLCLLLTVMQIGPLLVLLPAAIYMFATANTLPAVLFAVWAIVVGISDNVLKPFLLGRGVDAPMVVVLVGSLGGFITAGVVGLFVGAVIVTMGYRLFFAWLEGG